METEAGISKHPVSVLVGVVMVCVLGQPWLERERQRQTESWGIEGREGVCWGDGSC